MEETIGPSLNPVRSRHTDDFGISASRKSNVKYQQTQAM